MFANALRRQTRLGIATTIRLCSAPGLVPCIFRPRLFAFRSLSTTPMRWEEKTEEDVSRKPYPERPPNRTLMLGAVPREASESDLRAVFAPHGKIEFICIQFGELIAHPSSDRSGAGKCRGSALVGFADQDGADAAIKAGPSLAGTPLRVAYSASAPPCSEVHVSNLPAHVTETDLHRALARYGEIVTCRLTKHFRWGYRHGHVVFAEQSAAEEACKAGVRISDEVTLPVQFKRAEKSWVRGSEPDERAPHGSTPLSLLAGFRQLLRLHRSLFLWLGFQQIDRGRVAFRSYMRVRPPHAVPLPAKVNVAHRDSEFECADPDEKGEIEWDTESVYEEEEEGSYTDEETQHPIILPSLTRFSLHLQSGEERSGAALRTLRLHRIWDLQSRTLETLLKQQQRLQCLHLERCRGDFWTVFLQNNMVVPELKRFNCRNFPQSQVEPLVRFIDSRCNGSSALTHVALEVTHIVNGSPFRWLMSKAEYWRSRGLRVDRCGGVDCDPEEDSETDSGEDSETDSEEDLHVDPPAPGRQRLTV
ncbi:hypothetical protein C8R43DRAFT_1111791 [Mycena crocata]|nr:hypothetical protein C8R43DRAFT_1111791 [Mycena crocata]